MLFFWLLWGDFTIMLRERSVTPTFQYMLKELNASDFVLGLLVGFLPHAIGMVLGPVISYRSDRLRSPRGRRIPYLVLSTPPHQEALTPTGALWASLQIGAVSLGSRESAE